MLSLLSDQPNGVEVLNVCAIFEPVAGEFHADEIGDGGQQNPPRES